MNKTKPLGEPWKNHRIWDEENECFTCGFCPDKAINKVWLAGYVGVLVCEKHLVELEEWNHKNVITPIIHNIAQRR